MGTDHWAGGRSLQEREDKPGWTISCLPQEPPSRLFFLDVNYSGSRSREPQREALSAPHPGTSGLPLPSPWQAPGAWTANPQEEKPNRPD